ncbi:MAG TPA: matrixin family metalloprotease [Anaerolineales bacterium]|nr:matrixin family metalloprotease [Anaerolineales bacterium]
MKKLTYPNLFRTCMQILLLLAISLFCLGPDSVRAASTDTATTTEECGQLLQNAEAAFRATLASDGSVPANPETKAAALEYIRVSKLCYDEIQATNAAGALQGESPTFIDDGGIRLNSNSSAEYALTGSKWGSSTQGTSGGTITYSFMGNAISFATEGFGNSVALTSLPGFQPCFITKIQNAFAAWQAVANIQFVQVNDNGAAFNAAGATGDIRIGAHAFDGPSGTLAHAYYPPPNGNSAAGDLHFDSAENWSCTTNGTDIAIVALHEIGHSLGLSHENTTAVAVMDPFYNSSLTGLQSDDISGVESVYGLPALTAAAPVNDNFANASSKTVGSIPYSDTIDTSGATEELNDPQVNISCDGRLLNKGKKSVWYKYTAGSTLQISLDTIGSDYDTYIAVWTGNSLTNLNIVGCDDDRDADLQSQLVYTAVAGTTYYIEIAGYAGVQGTSSQLNPGGPLVFHVNLTNLNVRVGASVVDQYYVPLNESVRRSYDNLDNGPVRVQNTSGNAIISSQRINLKTNSTYISYTEFMGIPAGKLTDTYLFPWYNNANAGGLSSQLRFGNVGNASTVVTIKIAGVAQVPTYTLAPNQSAKVTLDNIDNGPVEVKSSGGVPIIASMRINLKKLPDYSSYTEFLGLSASSTVGTRYIFPWYNNANSGGLSSQLRFGNVGNASTVVSIKVAGVTQQQTYILSPNGSQRVTLPDVDYGPVEVFSSGGVPIIASMRVNLKTNPNYSSYSEFMGLPGVTLTDTRYLFPWYNNATNSGLSSQLRFANVGNASTTVSIKIAGVTQQQTYTLAPNASARVPLGNIDSGPVEVFSSGSVPIIASLRVNLMPNTSYSSYAEFMGLSVGSPLGMPGDELSTTYWFPWYNNATNGGLSSQLRFGMP